MSFPRLNTLLKCSRHGKHLNTLIKRRSLMTSTQYLCRQQTEEEDPNKPLVYSKSKAAIMTVGNSFGDKHKQPLKKVLTFSITGIALLLWIYTREETEVDQKLNRSLQDSLPGLFEESKDNENHEKKLTVAS
ncbi:protein CCSMST1-like [Anneissia japonica]|uniref:protein CCSMST1-like n=1 Tax=Anneissia japonica TaxID=1529436 RepID=UPI0014258AE1|nr:protein CCSMST1-like [Anneissia japonica]